MASVEPTAVWAAAAVCPPYKAEAIANYFLERGEEDSVKLSLMKLQKLIYFAHGWHLALVGDPLIDERIQAWEFGSVIRTVYDEFKSYGKDPIEGRAKSIEVIGIRMQFVQPEVPDSDGQTLDLLGRVWDVYKPFTAYQLSRLTHQAGTPWASTYSRNKGVRNLTIEDTIIKDFFQKMADANREQQSQA